MENEPEFPARTSRGIFNDLWEIVEEFYRANPQPQLGLKINYERVLGEMTALASWVTPSPFGNALRCAIQDSAPSAKFTWPADRTEPYFYRHLILDQLGFLLGKLADFMRGRSLSLDETTSAFKGFRSFLEHLRRSYQIGMYNLNYDDVATRVWPDAFTGFKGGKFDAREIGTRRRWDFIYHLHGSVHYSFVDPPFKGGLEWKDDLASSFETSRPLIPDMASEFKALVPTTLVAGGFKLDQLLADPVQTFHASLVRHAQEADAVLVMGYGFGDVHVNRALQNRFDLPPSNLFDRPPVVVIEKTKPLPFRTVVNRQGHDFWAYQLTHTLNCRFHMTERSRDAGLTVEQFVEQKKFEVDMNNRTAIWHGGFIEAFDLCDKINAWLGH